MLQSTVKAAAVYGVTSDQIRQELYDCFGSRQVASIYTAINDYYVILECDPKNSGQCHRAEQAVRQDQPQWTGHRRGTVAAAGSGVSGATTPTGPVVPLSALVREVPTIGALQVNHQGQLPAVTISFNLARVSRWARRSTPSTRRGRSMRLPRHDPRQLPGHCPGFPGFAGQPAAAGPGGGVRRSTSCWACSTRASSTRSPSSPPCRRPASARCWC